MQAEFPLGAELTARVPLDILAPSAAAAAAAAVEAPAPAGASGAAGAAGAWGAAAFKAPPRATPAAAGYAPAPVSMPYPPELPQLYPTQAASPPPATAKAKPPTKDQPVQPKASQLQRFNLCSLR
ncbi:hypothetical protein OEZ85_000408 [Tetradesmus obliquus]|uniref:Uncharacterized protein n=1 Tax=Tetradesmus obliquus TaxID=3088 RepID=A0ABY8UQ80_TETOB|nr:hypothetical protein OEZ85_000408 [Tetradesmus obliquus]